MNLDYVSFRHLSEIEDSIKIHGRFLQRKEKTPKIEVFEITDVYEDMIAGFVIYLDGKEFLFKEIENSFEFLDEHPFKLDIHEKLFEEFSMESSSDRIFYIKPIYQTSKQPINQG